MNIKRALDNSYKEFSYGIVYQQQLKSRDSNRRLSGASPFELLNPCLGIIFNFFSSLNIYRGAQNELF